MSALLETETRTSAGVPQTGGPLWVPGLTILYHPDFERIGERVPLPGLSSGRTEELSRAVPAFGPVGGGNLRPLADPYLSRRPFFLRPGQAPGAIAIERGESPSALSVEGEALAERRELDPEEVRRGVVLLVAGRIVLLLSFLDPLTMPGLPSCGLVGESAEVIRLRREIVRYASLQLPVLLRGETGTGKELAARALHQASGRENGPFLALNMGAIPPTLAASELFGALKGAFTGADRKRSGSFLRADGGTLFLDEVGETPPEVQALLLRVLETGEVTPVGGDEAVKVDVRLIAATDADLERAVDAGGFRAPLLHRLAGFEIRLPPLSARRDDFGRLFLHFVRAELTKLGVPEHLATSAEAAPWIPAPLVAHLAQASWPGNVRQLRNVVHQLVANGRDAGEPGMWLVAERLWREKPREAPGVGAPGSVAAPVSAGAEAPAPAPPPAVKRRFRRPDEVSEEELVAVLRAHRWRLQPAAAALGLSRPSLYDRIERSATLRKAVDLSRGEIEEALARCGGDLDRLVEALEVSKRGLQRRITQLGIELPLR